MKILTVSENRTLRRIFGVRERCTARQKKTA
jgi:hypothetical protein